jgi:hypothetical protein
MTLTWQKGFLGILTAFAIGIAAGIALDTAARTSREQPGLWSDSSWWPEKGHRREVTVDDHRYYGQEAEFLAGFPGVVCVYRDEDVLMLQGKKIMSRSQFRPDPGK